jgi:hypothetical protein
VGAMSYRLTYKYWNNILKSWGISSNYKAEGKSFADVLDKFYVSEAESDGDIKSLHIESIQKKTWLGWKEI